ncbi:hypothetical protein [Sphingomonas sp. BAUL-RG-20F-R05-02]|uniref:hypothetical protein n=1 Tax=Sphingomonas sp. BAUL-RG-20F-R05-02 TaxID=2914830 RepID=UPI001F5A3345|nr:hypothetical protein [Sphingomonas sp. BAUL-RG-20F-R05-02]
MAVPGRSCGYWPFVRRERIALSVAAWFCSSIMIHSARVWHTLLDIIEPVGTSLRQIR